MGTRGPAKTPKAVLQARNARNADRPEAEPAPGRPDEPTMLGDAGRDLWPRIVDELERMGILARIDGLMLTVLCLTWQEYLDAHAIVEAEGLTYQSGTRTFANPAVAIRAAARAELLRLARHFGLSPGTRIAGTAVEERDELAEYYRDIGQPRAAAQ